MRFEEGTFTQFYREIPSRLTDGLEVVSASMDGVVLPAGDGPGQVEIRRSSRTRVTWRFPRCPALHTSSSVTYVVRGAIRQTDDADVVAWRALPGQHAYRIDSSAIEIDLPVEPIRGAVARAAPGRRVGGRARRRAGEGSARATSSERLARSRARLPRGSAIDAPPQWQQRELAVRQSARIWIIAAAAVLIAGLLLIFGVRQGYDAPPRERGAATPGPALPDTLPPALAGALVTNGSSRLEHAMAALFSLADRGELTIEEQPRSFGPAKLRRDADRSAAARSPRTSSARSRLFSRVRAVTSDRSALGKARGRLTRHFKKFSSAVQEELAAAGLMDDGRREVRKRFLRLGVIALVAACGAPLGVFTAEDYGAWPMLIPLALAAVGVTRLHLLRGAHAALEQRRAESRLLACLPEVFTGRRAGSAGVSPRFHHAGVAAVRGGDRARAGVVHVSEAPSGSGPAVVPRRWRRRQQPRVRRVCRPRRRPGIPVARTGPAGGGGAAGGGSSGAS